MRHETLLKVIIITFAIVLIILATFVYGNIQRSNQKKSTSDNQNTVQTQTNSETSKENSSTSDKPTDQNNQSTQNTKPSTPTAAPTPAASVPSTGATRSIPATGASDAVVPMTILSVLGYLYIKSKNNKQEIQS